MLELLSWDPSRARVRWSIDMLKTAVPRILYRQRHEIRYDFWSFQFFIAENRILSIRSITKQVISIGLMQRIYFFEAGTHRIETLCERNRSEFSIISSGLEGREPFYGSARFCALFHR